MYSVQIFLWNLVFEWQLLLEPRTLPPPSCSDLYLVNGQNMTVMGHNEDGSPIDLTTGYLVHARISEEGGDIDEFLAFCYAGTLCGKAFGFNLRKETVMSVNAIFPKNISVTAMARNFLNRATMSQSLEEIRRTLQEVPCASGFSLNVGSLDRGDRPVLEVSNFEVAPSGVVETKIKGYDYHFNMYLHSKAPQYDDPSSVARLARVEELPPPTDPTDILRILGDTHNKQYPIYRTATPPDGAATLCTSLFDLSSRMFYLYRGNPSEVEPVMVVPLL